jgi:hypothetical protein
MNRLPSFACRTGDSAFGLGYSVSKVLKFGKLRSECLKTLAQSELAIIQPRTIHCTPLHYCTAPVGRRWDHPRLGKFSNHVCSLLDTGCTVPPGERSSCNERHAGSVANKYFLLKNVWPKRREAYVSKPRHYRQDKNEKALLRKARQAEIGAHMTEWLTSPGLRSPT